MRITDIKVAEAPIATKMSNAVIDFSKMTVSVIAVETDVRIDGRQVVGYGFNSNGRYAQSGLLTERILPRLMEAEPARVAHPETGLIDPVAVREVVMANEKPGGHGDRAVAVGILDMAVWDAVAKAANQPFYRALHDHFDLADAPLEAVPVYAAGGYYYPDGSIASLEDEMRHYLDLGYRNVKLKIGGATLREDLERIDAVLAVLPDGSRLAVDANGRFDVPTALRYAEALSAYDLMWYEEPCDPLDYRGHAVVAEAYDGVIATGENLFAVPEVQNLARYGGLRPDRDILQMDPCLSYGVSEYAGMLEQLRRHGWRADRCCPHGGHQYNLGVAAAFGLGGCESYPMVFHPFGGFADDTPIEDGLVRPAQVPGIGIENKAPLWELIRGLF